MARARSSSGLRPSSAAMPAATCAALPPCGHGREGGREGGRREEGKTEVKERREGAKREGGREGGREREREGEGGRWEGGG